MNKLAGILCAKAGYRDNKEIVLNYRSICDHTCFVTKDSDFSNSDLVDDLLVFDHLTEEESMFMCSFRAHMEGCNWIHCVPENSSSSDFFRDKRRVLSIISKMKRKGSSCLLVPTYSFVDEKWIPTGFYYPIIFSNPFSSEGQNKFPWQGGYSFEILHNESLFLDCPDEDRFFTIKNEKIFQNNRELGNIIFSENKDVELSVIIPYYKKFHSFLIAISHNYWFKDPRVEVVLVLDEPSEEALIRDLIIENFSEVKFRVIVNNKDHDWRPPCKALNVGLKFSKGKYIGVISPETILLFPDYNYIFERLRDLDSDIFITGFVNDYCIEDSYPGIDEYGCGYFEAYNGYKNKRPLPMNYGSFFVRKELLEKIKGWDESRKVWGGDDDNVRLRLYDIGVKKIPDPKIKAMHNIEKKLTKKFINKSEGTKSIVYNFNQEPYGEDFSNVVYDWSSGIDTMSRLSYGDYDIVMITRKYTSNISVHKIINNIIKNCDYKCFVFSCERCIDSNILFQFLNKVKPKVVHNHGYICPNESDYLQKLEYNPFFITTVHSGMFSSYLNISDVVACIHYEAYRKNKPLHPRVITIENSVDIDKSLINPEFRKSPRRVVLSCRFDPENISIEIIRRLNKLGTEVCIIGHDDKSKFSRDIKNACVNCHHNIKILDWTDDIENIIIDYDIFAFIKPKLSPLRSVGLNVMEAASLGIPCLITKKKYHRQPYVIHGVNGFIAEETEDFFSFLELMVWDDELYSNLKKGAVDYAMELTNKMPEDYISLYKEVLG